MLKQLEQNLDKFNNHPRTLIELDQFDIELFQMNCIAPKFYNSTHKRNRLIVSLLEFMDDSSRFHREIPNDVLLGRYLNGLKP
jgi:hypothetical protein